MLGGLGIGLVLASIVATAWVRDPSALDLLEGAPSASGAGASAPGVPGSAGSGTEVAPARDRATDDELAQANGKDAVGALAARYPSDAKVAKKLLAALLEDPQSLAQAVAQAKHLVELDAGAAHDELVKRAATKGASGPAVVADAAFELLTKMGPDGADTVFDLATGGAAVPAGVRERATKALADPQMRDAMSPALHVAADLKKATPCERRALLPAAEKDGDRRALPYLEPLMATKGCGFLSLGDCYGCFGNRSELTRTIGAIKAR
jgi:hypothetical protein